MLLKTKYINIYLLIIIIYCINTLFIDYKLIYKIKT